MVALREIPVYTVLGSGDLAALIALIVCMGLVALRRRGDLLGIGMMLMMGTLVTGYLRFYLQDMAGWLGLGLAAAALGTYGLLQFEVRRVYNAGWARAAAACYGLTSAAVGILLVVTDNVQAELPTWAALPTLASLACLLWAVARTEKGPYLPAD